MACCENPKPTILERNGRLFCANCRRYLSPQVPVPEEPPPYEPPQVDPTVSTEEVPGDH